MIQYLSGKVVSIENKYIILYVAGIGFKIYYSNPSFIKLNQFLTIPIYYHVKEDERALYGFKDELERNLFIDLISVNGVGPKTSFNMISKQNYEYIIDAIKKSDVSYLKSISSIGPKIANQIILELSTKFKKIKFNTNQVFIEAKQVLKQLNFKSEEIDRALSNIKNDYKSVDECVSECLKILAK